MNQGLPKADDTDDFKRFYARMVCHVLNYMEDNEKVVKLILKSSMQLTLVEILSEQLIQDCITKIKLDRKKGIQYPASPNTMASFYVDALMFTIRFWYLSDKQMTKEEIQKEIQAIVDSINHDCTAAE